MRIIWVRNIQSWNETNGMPHTQTPSGAAILGHNWSLTEPTKSLELQDELPELDAYTEYATWGRLQFAIMYQL